MKKLITVFILLFSVSVQAQVNDLCWHQPGSSSVFGWKIYIGPSEIIRILPGETFAGNVINQDCTSQICFCYHLPSYIIPNQPQLTLTACSGGFDQSCSAMSNQWPTQTPTNTPTVTATATLIPTNTALPTNTPLNTQTPINTQTPLPTNTLAPTQTQIIPTITPTPWATPQPPLVLCVGTSCITISP